MRAPETALAEHICAAVPVAHNAAANLGTELAPPQLQGSPVGQDEFITEFSPMLGRGAQGGFEW